MLQTNMEQFSPHTPRMLRREPEASQQMWELDMQPRAMWCWAQPAAEKLNKQWGNGQIWLGGLLEVKKGTASYFTIRGQRAHVTGKKVITTDQQVPDAHTSGLVQCLTLRPVLLQEKEEAIREL